MSGRSWSMAVSMLATSGADEPARRHLVLLDEQLALALDGEDGGDAEADDEHDHDQHGDLGGEADAHAGGPQTRDARPAQ